MGCEYIGLRAFVGFLLGLSDLTIIQLFIDKKKKVKHSKLFNLRPDSGRLHFKGSLFVTFSYLIYTQLLE